MKMQDMIAWMRSKVGKGYVYGATGQICTQALLDELEARWGSDHKYDEARKWIGVEVYDCVNLIKDCRRELDDKWTDVSADGLFKISKVKDLRRAVTGDLLFRVRNGKAEHVGTMVAPGRCIEARSTARGVVESVVVDKDWTHAAENPWLDYYDPEIQKAVDEMIITDPDLWQAYLDGKKPVDPGHLRALLTKYNKRL